jgi:hypothetical protein
VPALAFYRDDAARNLNGMQEVRGSNPLSSTIFHTLIREKVPNYWHLIMA